MQADDQRRKGRDADTAREAILNAAEEVFARHGFSGARVDEIADVAGYNKALLFHYFGDKVNLYKALVSRTKERNIAFISKHLEQFFGENGEQRLDAEAMQEFLADVIRWLFDQAVAHPRTTRIMAWEAAEGWQTFAVCGPFANASEGWPARVHALIRRAQAEGVFRAELDPEMILAMVMTLPMFHIVSLRRLTLMFPDSDFSSPAALARAREQLVELVLHGVLANPGSPSPVPGSQEALDAAGV